MKVLLSILLALCCLGTLTLGEIPWETVWQGALHKIQDSSSWNPLIDERLPRLIVLLCTGASLAVAGAVMQALFQNPLASPSVLGISCGGSLAVIPIFIFEWHVSHPFFVPLAAFGGCLGTLLLVYALARKNGRVPVPTLILTGIAISTLLFAIQGAILYALRDNWQLVQMITEWEAGSTADRNWKHVNMQLPLTLMGLIGCLRYRRELNLLALGDEEALNLGVDVTKVRWRLFLFVALLTGGAIAAVGIIAFFGLVLPHLLRQSQGADHVRLIPMCILGGAAFLALMDNLLRLFSIHALSIGNVSAILGGLFFLILLVGYKRTYAES
ncbi:MAG: iron ABC transporter permease [Parachlamydia sp.]|nr:iron ABC transporter permease [Parachlamydia sp.]